jgi:HD-GYP domain-containing protein (c-di-GMP phosphodiesterase class II)
MSPQARMMGIADVFEALTAGDRPYKVGMRMSQAMRILCQMAVDQHIDRDLFEIFLRKRVYLDYAERFLTPEQRDPIDWTAMPGLSDDLRDALCAHASARPPTTAG